MQISVHLYLGFIYTFHTFLFMSYLFIHSYISMNTYIHKLFLVWINHHINSNQDWFEFSKYVFHKSRCSLVHYTCFALLNRIAVDLILHINLYFLSVMYEHRSKIFRKKRIKVRKNLQRELSKTNWNSNKWLIN